MNGTVTFDTHAFVKRLRAVGFSEEQAEAQVKAISKAMESKELATKRDLAELELRLIKWMIGVAAAQATLIVALLKLL